MSFKKPDNMVRITGYTKELVLAQDKKTKKNITQ